MKNVLYKSIIFLIGISILSADVPVSINGWSQLTPSEDSRVIYVSSTEGADTNDGLSPESPKKTIASADTLIRNGYPDFLLLKRGDTFSPERLFRWKEGRSADEPLVMGAYGTGGSRPVIEIDSIFINHDGLERDYLAFIGLDFYKPTADPRSDRFANQDSNSALRFVGGGRNILVEDCRFRFVSVSAEGNYHEFKFRRNILAGVWAHGSSTGGPGAQGLFMNEVSGYLIEENVFYHNGWNEDVEGAGANMFDHNVYIQYTNSAGGVMRGNFSIRGAAHGWHGRAGGALDRNFFAENAVNANLGGQSDPTDPRVLDFDNRFVENVILNGREQVFVPGGSQTGAIWGFAGGFVGDIEVRDNIIANRDGDYVNRAFLEGDEPIFMNLLNNIVYKWEPKYDTDISSWPHPDDDLGDYNAFLGGANSREAFYTALLERGPGEFPWELTTYAANSYIRSGFNRGPIGGYYTYEGQPAEPVTGVSMTTTPEFLNLQAGEVATVCARVSPVNASNQNLIWTSSDPSVAQMLENYGRIWGVAEGTTTLTVTTADGGFFDTVEVNVTGTVPVTGISGRVALTSIGVNETTRLVAEVEPFNASNQEIEWSSPNPEVVTVDADGMVRGVSPGSAAVRATTADGGFTDTTLVVVKALDTWAGYPLSNDGWANTGGHFLGWIYTEQKPWLYSYSLESWIFIYEPDSQPGGVWVYFSDFGSIRRNGKADWVLIDELVTYGYMPPHDTGSTSGWCYIIDTGTE